MGKNRKNILTEEKIEKIENTDTKKNKKWKIKHELTEDNCNTERVEEQPNDVQHEEGSTKSKRKKKSKPKRFLDETCSVSDDNEVSNVLISPKMISQNIDSAHKQNKRKKNNKEYDESNNGVKEEVAPLQSNKSKSGNKKNKALNQDLKNTRAEDQKSNKLRSILDVPLEVNSNAKKQKGNKQNMNEDEALVNDEDIDRFCDEIDEEDNAQFEDWVKLLEAKLGKK